MAGVFDPPAAPIRTDGNLGRTVPAWGADLLIRFTRSSRGGATAGIGRKIVFAPASRGQSINRP